MVNEILIWRNTCGISWWISKIRTYWNRQRGGMISDQIHKKEGVISYICLSPLCFLIPNGVSMLSWWSVLSWTLKGCPSANFWNSFILMQRPFLVLSSVNSSSFASQDSVFCLFSVGFRFPALLPGDLLEAVGWSNSGVYSI